MIYRVVKNCKKSFSHAYFGHASKKNKEKLLFYTKTALIANIISIIPPKISRYFDGSFLNEFPSPKPKIDIKNDARPIMVIEIKRCAFVNFKLMPAAIASILVAIPRPIRHFKPMQQTVSSFS